jgi:hypothetical protein
MNESRVSPQLFIALNVLEYDPRGLGFRDVTQIVNRHPSIRFVNLLPEFVTVEVTKLHMMVVDKGNKNSL